MPYSLPLALGADVLSGMLGTLFLAAGVAKLQDRPRFLGELAAYRLLPDGLVFPIAAILPVVETALGVVLMTGLAPLPAAGLAFGLLGLFTLAMAITLLRGRTNISCGCLPGADAEPLSWRSVARTAALTVLTGPILLFGGISDNIALHLQALACGITLFGLGLAARQLLAFPEPRSDALS